MIKRVFISDHAVKRFQERFRKEAGQSTSPRQIRNMIWDYIIPENENKLIFNNSAIMTEMYANHGYDRDFTFFAKNDKIFVGAKSDYETVTILTVLRYNGRGKTKFFKSRKKYNVV